MTTRIRIEIATLNGTYTSPLPDVDNANILRWFLADKADPLPEGLTQAEENQFYLNQAARELADYIRREAFRNRLQMRQAERTIEQEVEAETGF